MTVVLPALMASRTYIHVSLSMKTESTASMGRGEFGSGLVGSGTAAKTSDKKPRLPRTRVRVMAGSFGGDSVFRNATQSVGTEESRVDWTQWNVRRPGGHSPPC